MERTIESQQLKNGRVIIGERVYQDEQGREVKSSEAFWIRARRANANGDLLKTSIVLEDRGHQRFEISMIDILDGSYGQLRFYAVRKPKKLGLIDPLAIRKAALAYG